MAIPIDTTNIISVARALISGVTPSFTFEKITIGKVFDPAPDVKLAITKSSSDRVNASSHPESIAGEIMGRVISTNTLKGRPPRSMAASSSERFMVSIRD